VAHLPSDASPQVAPTPQVDAFSPDPERSGVIEPGHLQDAVSATDGDPVSGVRTVFATSLDIENIFWEAAGS